jgi:hypothetical protein
LIPIKLVIIYAKNLLEKIRVLGRGLITRKIHPVQLSGIFPGYIQGIYFFIVGFTIPKNPGSREGVPCRSGNIFYFGEATKVAIKTENYGI